MTYTDYILHYGIEGQKWGQRNGPPYPLGSSQMSRAERRAERKDVKWAKRNYNKIYKKAYNVSKNDLKEAEKDVASRTPKYISRGKMSKQYMSAYNKKMAEIMSSNISDLHSPSGRVIKFVAKRGELGVHMILADEAYDMSQLKNGIYGSGRIAYKKKVVDRV